MHVLIIVKNIFLLQLKDTNTCHATLFNRRRQCLIEVKLCPIKTKMPISYS